MSTAAPPPSATPPPPTAAPPTATARAAQPPPVVGILLAAGLALFVITVVIGILNGTDVVDFGRNTLLVHVHAGTLGWLTLAVVAGAIWMFDPAPGTSERIGWATLAAVVIYVVAFWTGDDLFRPIAGTIMFVAVLAIVAWVLGRRAGVTRHVPRLAVMLSLLSLLVGAVLGILLGLAVSGRADWVPNGVADAHPPTMVIGYLVLAALGLSEWLLTGDQADDAATAVAEGRPPRLGQWQVVLVFLAGVTLVLGIIFEIEPLIILNAPLEVIGLGIFYRRLWSRFRAVSWTTPGHERWVAIGMVYLFLNLLMLLYLIGSTQGDFDALRFELILALDHLMFVGALTPVLFGMVRLVNRSEPTPGESLTYWGVVLGVAVFVLGLIADAAVLKRIGTPVLGLSLLHLIATAELRLLGRRTA